MRDSVSDFYERLFEAARQERAPSGLRQRIMKETAVAPGSSHQSETVVTAVARRRLVLRWAVGTGVAAAALLAVFAHRQIRDDGPTIEKEPASVVSTAQRVNATPPSSAPPDEHRSEKRTRQTARVPRADQEPKPRADTSLDLSEELQLLKEARETLRGGDGRRALIVLDEYENRPGRKRLQAESTLLRIEALASIGQHQKATQLAQGFVKANPNSPLVDRAYSFIEVDGGDGDAGNTGPGEGGNHD